MTEGDRRLMVETISEIKELKGEMKEFKEHVVGRVHKLETKEAERGKNYISIISLIIASLSIIFSFIFNLIKHLGK